MPIVAQRTESETLHHANQVNVPGFCVVLAFFLIWFLPALLDHKPAVPTASAATPALRPLNCWVCKQGVGVARRKGETILLIEDLDKPDRVIQQLAYQQLLKIGPEALWQFHYVRHETDAGRRLGFQVYAEIQSKHGVQPSQHNGLEFLPVGDPVWQAPPLGQGKPVKLGVKLTNVSEKVFRFYRFSTIRPFLLGPDGKRIMPSDCIWCGNNVVNSYTPPLAKGQSYLMTDFSAYLYPNNDRKTYELHFQDPGKSLYILKNLTKGRYYLGYWCVSNPENATPDKNGHPTWNGDTSTPYVAIEIK